MLTALMLTAPLLPRQVMMRLKNVRHLDPRQAGVVEGAYYAAKAPKGGVNAARRKKRPPLQVRHAGGCATCGQDRVHGLLTFATLPSTLICPIPSHPCFHPSLPILPPAHISPDPLFACLAFLLLSLPFAWPFLTPAWHSPS